ncbi:MAG: hypothetical protein J7623_21195 [Chitinophaga sp.]|nr:hypothetical protein [Chitinophaga sp.]
MSDAYLDYYVKEVPRFFWWEGLGITNARAFRKFLTYHGIEAQAVHRRFIYFPRYKMPGSQIPDRLFFIDDGTVNIYSSKFPGICVNVSFYESRFMYRKLVKHLGFKNLEVLDWV